MKRTTREFASTRVDRHFERLAPNTLERMASDINAGYMPLWIEHDPRLAPVGRVVEAHIEPQPDGELALIGTIEEFESTDRIPFDPDRKMFIRSLDGLGLYLAYDRSYRDAISLALIEDIGKILGTTPQPEAKKALEPLSVLVLTGAFILGEISSGFLKQVGADGYKLLKAKLQLLLARRRAKKEPYIFRFSAMTSIDQRTVEVDFLISGATSDSLERPFHVHLAAADSMLIDYLPTHPEVQRVVFDATGAKLAFVFAVRSDAVPFFQRPAGA